MFSKELSGILFLQVFVKVGCYYRQTSADHVVTDGQLLCGTGVVTVNQLLYGRSVVRPARCNQSTERISGANVFLIIHGPADRDETRETDTVHCRAICELFATLSQISDISLPEHLKRSAYNHESSYSPQ